MRVTDIVNSAKLTVGQIFSCPTVQHFQFELLRVSAALTHETGTAMVLVCRHPTSDEAVSDAVFGCEDFVSPFAREVVPNHFQFEPEVEFPHMPSKVVSNSWGSVQTRGGSVTAVFLSRNFGKEAALAAGLAHAVGAAVVVMDADLQDPPELIPRMMRAWKDGADVICMRCRARAGETWFKRHSAHHFYRVLNAVSDVEIPPDTGDFRLLSRKAIYALQQLNEQNRYMKGLFAWIGLPTTVIEYDRMPRAGATKWDYRSLFNLAFQGITSFSTAPLRLVIAGGLLTAFFGIVFALWIVAKALVLGDPVQGYPSLISMITILGGAQLLSIGLLGEYVGKTYYETKQRPVYLVHDVLKRGRVADQMSANSERSHAAKNGLI